MAKVVEVNMGVPEKDVNAEIKKQIAEAKEKANQKSRETQEQEARLPSGRTTKDLAGKDHTNAETPTLGDKLHSQTVQPLNKPGPSGGSGGRSL